jgi:rare lipoprotein A
VQRGLGSWYGKKFHGQKTASGEIYDMFKMTAAHTTLPLPSYVRVTNLRNGRQVIVRVNDRGPFHSARIIDLSYTAALKLDMVRGGSAELEVERLLPDEIARLQSEKQKTRQALQAAIGADDPITRPLSTEVKAEVKTDTAQMSAIPGFYLQFGAYAQQGNAMAMRERLMSSWPSQLPVPSVVQHQGLYRLHSGPFASRTLADEASRQLQGASQIKTTIVQR